MFKVFCGTMQSSGGLWKKDIPMYYYSTTTRDTCPDFTLERTETSFVTELKMELPRALPHQVFNTGLGGFQFFLCPLFSESSLSLDPSLHPSLSTKSVLVANRSSVQIGQTFQPQNHRSPVIKEPFMMNERHDLIACHNVETY